jgi:hypothetical protein
MNAPIRVSDVEVTAPPIKIFTACAEKYALSCAFGEMDIQDAVEGLQSYADWSGLVVELGQDRVQDILAAAFIWAREEADSDEADDTLDSDYAAQIVRQWEMADSRDRWRHTGELPPAPEAIPGPTSRPPRVPQSTIDAFKYVVGLGDPDLLARWLRDHSDVSAALLKEVGSC